MTRTQALERTEQHQRVEPDFAFDAHARLTDSDTGNEVLAEGPAILTAEGGWMLATDSEWAEIQRARRTGEPLQLSCDCDSHVRPSALRVKRFIPYSDTLEVEPITNDADPAEHQASPQHPKVREEHERRARRDAAARLAEDRPTSGRADPGGGRGV